MSASAQLENRVIWEPPPTPDLDQTVWQAWLAKGRAQETASHINVGKAGKILSLAALLLAAVLWSTDSRYEVVIRFVVACGAMFAMFEAFDVKQYAFAVVFGAVALLYNPVAPIFGFSGEWQRSILAASAIPFFASLVILKPRKKPHA
jgi:hypothetical protein